MSKVYAFLKSRPTETWLGLWTAVIAIIWGTGEVPAWTAAVTTGLAWLLTFVASRPSNSLGPQPAPE